MSDGFEERFERHVCKQWRERSIFGLADTGREGGVLEYQLDDILEAVEGAAKEPAE